MQERMASAHLRSSWMVILVDKNSKQKTITTTTMPGMNIANSTMHNPIPQERPPDQALLKPDEAIPGKQLAESQFRVFLMVKK